MLSDHERIDRLAEQFVCLCLNLNRFDPGYVNFYFGPENLKEPTTDSATSLRENAKYLLEQLRQVDLAPYDLLWQRRIRFLIKYIDALIARIDYLSGIRLSFDEESRQFYDAVLPNLTDDHFENILGQINVQLPGTGSLIERFNNFRNGFIIPADKLMMVLDAAISEARTQTRQHITLPPDESFVAESVTNQPWTAYNWFRGNGKSLIQINTDLPVHLDFLLLIACHEGYPGHHTFFCLREQEFYQKRGWIEYSICPLFSPVAVIAEGLANFGLNMVFPTINDRIRFERDTLCPLAGIDTANLERFEKINDLYKQLTYAESETARRYFNGKLSRGQALEYLIKYRLLPSERAEKHMEFTEFYRAYVINYTTGEDLVKEAVERLSAPTNDENARWKVFTDLMTLPVLPSDLSTLQSTEKSS